MARVRSAQVEGPGRHGGELGAGHTVTALYEVVPVGADSEADLRATDPLRYRESETWHTARNGDELLFVKLRYKQPTGSESRLLTHAVPAEVDRPSTDLRWAAAVAAFGMVLRDSEHRGDWNLGDVLGLAEGSRGEDEGGYRSAFIEMVQKARGMELIATTR